MNYGFIGGLQSEWALAYKPWYALPPILALDYCVSDYFRPARLEVP